MGYSVSHSICIGFRFSFREATEPFVTRTPEEFHMEPRFDPKTGKPAGEEKIVDKHGYETYRIGDFEYEDYHRLFDTLAASCRCGWGVLGSYCLSMDENKIVIYVEMPSEIDTGDGMDTNGSFKLNDVVAAQSKVKQLEKNLTSLGMDLSNKDAEVILMWTHG